MPLDQKSELVPAFTGGTLQKVLRDEVDYSIPTGKAMFSDVTYSLPALPAMKGARSTISAKYVVQSLPLKEREVPYVDTYDEDEGVGLTTSIGRRIGVRKAPVGGSVTNVTPDYVEIRGVDGKRHRVDLYNHLPHARLTYTTDRPLVRVGDSVKPGAPVAASNYVADDGTLTIGRNLKVAFMAGPEGSTFEDAITMSRSAADKLTSTHLFGFQENTKGDIIVDKKRFISQFGDRYTKEQLDKFGDDGLPKAGVTLNPGDPTILALAPRTLSTRDAAIGKLGKVMRESWVDRSQQWDKPRPGVVVDAVRNRSDVRVNVKTDLPLAIGDKVSAKQGAKGVVGKIVSDDKMPRGEDGQPVDVFINTAALIGRVNPAMVFEALLGKVAKKTGKRILVPQFPKREMVEMVDEFLKRHNVSPTETLYDPVSGRKIPGVLTGNQYFLKLEHMSDTKLSGRGQGAVDINDQPSKNDPNADAAKRLGGLVNLALISHGATEVLRDAKVYRGSGNPEMWNRIKRGLPLPPPRIPFVYEKYLNLLRAAGINVEEKADRVTIKAMTDRDVMALSPKKIESAETIDPVKGEPVPGGLFDHSIFGGPDGKRWGYIALDEPVPNPIMEESIAHLLGITNKKLRAVYSGSDELGGKRGPKALLSALKAIDLDKFEKEKVEEVRYGVKTKRDKAVKGLRAARGLKKAGLRPEDTMITKVPVIPPAYRPAVVSGDMVLVSDANYLYKDMLESRNALRSNRKYFGDEDLVDDRLAVFDALRAVQGFGDPIHPEHREKGVKGFVKQIAGSGGPKTGFFISKVIGHPVNSVGRAAIIPDARLDMDHIALPEKMAWEIYGPFTMGRLVRGGMAPTQAAEEVEKRTQTAKRAMLEEMAHRPVKYSRDPALHRFSIMGAYPVLAPGSAIRISPLVVGPFNADFDGDQMNVHVPISEEAVKEIREKMMPSKNLLSIRDRTIHYYPSQEFILGLYNITTPDVKKEKRRFATVEEAKAAYKAGNIDIDTPIEITNGKRT